MTDGSDLSGKLHYGDNLDILRGFPDECVDLVYLDPPFNSNRSYNVIFKDESGRRGDAQIKAFDDTWHWGPKTEAHYAYLTDSRRHEGRVPESVTAIFVALRRGLGASQMTAYLVEMAVRLVELRRVLKQSGSLYLHCDPTASHYLKLVLDGVFGAESFINEIIWHYRKWSAGSYTFQRNHDVLLFYARSQARDRTFNQLFMERAPSTVRRFGNARIVSGYDKSGRRLPSVTASQPSEGVRMDDVWSIGRVPPIKQLFPTEKPLALLERIIEASSNAGDVVLDPFCGCGTAVAAAQKLGRQWIGIDITHLAIAVIRSRMRDMFGIEGITVEGLPTEVEGAKMLARQSLDGRYEFQYWALSLVGAQPVARKKGADHGIDGRITFTAGKRGEVGEALVEVKSGHVDVSQVRGLKGAMGREKSEFGLFITLEEPSKPMLKEAAEAGTYHSQIAKRDYPRVQILTIRELLQGARPSMPPMLHTFWTEEELPPRQQRRSGTRRREAPKQAPPVAAHPQKVVEHPDVARIREDHARNVTAEEGQLPLEDEVAVPPPPRKSQLSGRR